MKKILPVFLILFSVSSVTYANDDTQFRFGITHWLTEGTGAIDIPDIPIPGTSLIVDLDIDLDRDYRSQQELNTATFFELRHPIPLLPNLRLTQVNLQHDAVGKSVRTLNLPGSLDISHIDGTLFYTISDNNEFTIDAGISVRKFDGEMIARVIPQIPGFSIVIPPTKLYAPIESTLALIYTNVDYHFPQPNIHAVLNLSGGKNSKQQGKDISVQLRLDTLAKVELAAGYRYFDAELIADSDVGDVLLTLEVEGPFLTVGYHF